MTSSTLILGGKRFYGVSKSDARCSSDQTNEGTSLGVKNRLLTYALPLFLLLTPIYYE